MLCQNCGAEINELDSKCPYCGTLNPIGAEAAYMEQLDDILADTEALSDVPNEHYEQHLKHHGAFALKVALLVIGICLLLFLGIQAIISFSNQQEKKNIQEEFAFQKEYFPQLDELYETGDDAQVYAYLNELYELDGSSALYDWEHQAYYFYYDMHLHVDTLAKALESGTASDYEWTSGFYYAMSLVKEGIWESDYHSLSNEELEKIHTFQTEAATLLSDAFGLDSEEALDEAFAACSDDGFLDYKRCEKYIANYKED